MVTLAFFICLLVLNISPGAAILVNRTIDDKNGDEITHTPPAYSPAEGWSQGDTCTGCHVNSTIANVSRAFDKTWHDATYHPGQPERVISMSFTGTAVYAFFLLANQIISTTTLTNLSFVIDGAPVGPQFIHQPDSTTDILYNVSVFSHSGLSNTQHQFEIHAGGSNDSLLLFDYVIYTADEDDSTTTTTSTPTSSRTSTAGNTSLKSTSSLGASSSSTNTATSLPVTHHPTLGPILGGVLGGVALALISAISFFVIRRRYLALSKSDATVTPFLPQRLAPAAHPSNRTGTPLSRLPMLLQNRHLTPLPQQQRHSRVWSRASPAPQAATSPRGRPGRSRYHKEQRSSGNRSKRSRPNFTPSQPAPDPSHQPRSTTPRSMRAQLLPFLLTTGRRRCSSLHMAAGRQWRTAARWRRHSAGPSMGARSILRRCGKSFLCCVRSLSRCSEERRYQCTRAEDGTKGGIPLDSYTSSLSF